MAQTGIRKGFFFYFGLFILLLVAVFLIILVILFFNPGKSILGLQYFTASENSTALSTTTDDSKTAIDITQITEFDIDCGYANVIVQKTSTQKNTAVVIDASLSGFATSGQSVDFSYSATLDGTKLTISVTEPEGFLYLSKSLTIYITVYKESSSYTFTDASFVINTTSGNVTIGAYGVNHVTYDEISPKALDITTESGNINLSQMSYSNITALSLATTSGTISSSCNNIVLDGESSDDANAKGIDVANVNVTIKATSGKISYDVIRVINGNLKILTTKGNFVVDNIIVYTTAENGLTSTRGVVTTTIEDTLATDQTSKITIDCTEGNYVIGSVYGDVSFTPSEDKLNSPNITITTLNGDFTITSGTSGTSSPKIKIGTMTGNLTSTGTDGDFYVNDFSDGYVNVETGSGDIKINYASGYTITTANTITSTSGDITVGFKGTLLGGVFNLKSKSGDVKLNVTNSAYFSAGAYTYDGAELLSTSKVTLSVSNSVGDANNFIIAPTSYETLSSGEYSSMQDFVDKSTQDGGTVSVGWYKLNDVYFYCGSTDGSSYYALTAFTINTDNKVAISLVSSVADNF